jgi:hypothetical protein
LVFAAFLCVLCVPIFVNSVLKIPPLPLPFPIFTSLRHYFYASHCVLQTSPPRHRIRTLRRSPPRPDAPLAFRKRNAKTPQTPSQGKFRIARDLRARGVPDTHIQSAIEESADESAERAAIRHRIDRKLKLTRGEISDKKIASLYRSLIAAGFPSDAIRRELKSITHEELPVPDDPLDEASS